jgi:hypothetical protein
VNAYSEFGKRKIRKNGIHEFVLNKMKNYKVITEDDYNVSILPKIDTKEFESLLDMLNNIIIPFKVNRSNRRGFPKHRAVVFGLTKKRFTGIVEESVYSIKYPKIYEEIKRLGDLICPFKYTSIHVNHNVVCPPHKDSKNVNKSVIVSFGNYSGCDLVVSNTTYNTCYSPIMFNGSILEHYNINDLTGNKYSLVYYICQN